MNILLVSQEYPPETAHGGIATQTYSKALGLSELGHTVYVISHSTDGKRHEHRDPFIHVIRIPGMDGRLFGMTEIVRWITYSTLVAEEIERLQSKLNIDIIDFPEWAAEGYVYLLNRKEWSAIPVVIQLHGPLVMFGHKIDWPDMESSFYRTGLHMEATCVQLANGVYSSSECSAQWIRQYYLPQKNEIPVIHMGVDTSIFKPLPVEKHPNPTIIFTGKIVPNKGVTELVEAASRISRDIPGLRLKLIGKGEDSFISKLRQSAEQFEAPELLEFPGFLNMEALPEQLSRAHIFAAPSWYEGGPGFVYLEAMACGLPVIGCSGSGMDENIIDGYNGFLVPPKNVAELADVLQKILSRRDTLAEMGNNALNYIESHCTRKECIKELEEYYFQVISDQLPKTDKF
jgi:1,4-alpha-glucan branching enzyme